MYLQFLCLSGMFYWQVVSLCLWHFSYNHSPKWHIDIQWDPKRAPTKKISKLIVRYGTVLVRYHWHQHRALLLTMHLVTITPGDMEFWNSGKEVIAGGHSSISPCYSTGIDRTFKRLLSLQNLTRDDDWWWWSLSLDFGCFCQDGPPVWRQTISW